MNIHIAFIITIILCVLPFTKAFSEEAPIIASSYETAQTAGEAASHFTLIILGTRNASDINVIRKNLSDRPYVQLLVPTSVSQKHLEFAGTYTGSPEALLGDIKGLALDRYEMKTKQMKSSELVITLRKIRGSASSESVSAPE